MAQKAPTPGWVLLYIEIKKFLLAKKALNIVVEPQFLQMELHIVLHNTETKHFFLLLLL